MVFAIIVFLKGAVIIEHSLHTYLLKFTLILKCLRRLQKTRYFIATYEFECIKESKLRIIVVLMCDKNRKIFHTFIFTTIDGKLHNLLEKKIRHF